jgi:hypothetical protein
MDPGRKPRAVSEQVPGAFAIPVDAEANRFAWHQKEKYADPGIIRQAMGLLVIKEPYAVKTEKEGSVTTYTVEGITIGTSSEIPADGVQVYKVGWENGRIISIEFKGPKKFE